MTAVIIARDFAREFVFEGKKVSGCFFIGATSTNDNATFGLGFELPATSDGRVWGMLWPKSVVHAWRAFHVLKEISIVDDYTLSYCWNAVSRQEGKQKDKAISELQKQ